MYNIVDIFFSCVPAERESQGTTCLVGGHADSLYDVRACRTLGTAGRAAGTGNSPTVKVKHQQFALSVLERYVYITWKSHLGMAVEFRILSKWHDLIGGPTLVDAILDRIVHNSHKIESKGESMRRIKASLKMAA